MNMSYLMKLVEWVIETPGAIIKTKNGIETKKVIVKGDDYYVSIPLRARIMEPEEVAELPDSVAVKLLKDLGLIKPLTDELRAKLTENIEMIGADADDAAAVIDFLRVQTGATVDQIVEFYEEYFRSDTRVGS